MNITWGPKLEAYSRMIVWVSPDQTYQEAFDEYKNSILEWANSYVNHPELFEHQELIEKTSEERFKSLCKYIDWRLSQSSNERIRASVQADKQVAA